MSVRLIFHWPTSAAMKSSLAVATAFVSGRASHAVMVFLRELTNRWSAFPLSVLMGDLALPGGRPPPRLVVPFPSLPAIVLVQRKLDKPSFVLSNSPAHAWRGS